MDHDRTLRVLIGRKTRPISFAPQDSDLIVNALVVEQVVGTLTRLSPHGRYEPYLAESWHVSPNKLTWDFRLRPGLKCEDGTEINAANYVNGLLKVLRLLIGHTDLPIIKQLTEWERFKAGEEQFSGLQAPDKHLVRFQFASVPSSGFLEYLGLPYLGFYCASDFNPDGSWKDTTRAISSGPYALEIGDGSYPIKLRKREHWFSHLPGSPEELIFEAMPFSDALQKISKYTALYESLENQSEVIDGFQIVRLIPSFFSHVVINPRNSEFLNNRKNRSAIRDAINKKKWEMHFSYASARTSDALYPHMVARQEPSGDATSPTHRPEKPLKIMAPNAERPLPSYVRTLVQAALDELNIPYLYLSADQIKNGYMAGWKDETAFDIKIDSVDVGGGIENQLIKFMFCSKLGISFPDPSGRICTLVDEFEKRYGDVLDEAGTAEYSRRLDAIMHEDAAVVPILHYGPSWILGERINPAGFSPNMGIPYFDQVELR